MFFSSKTSPKHCIVKEKALCFTWCFRFWELHKEPMQRSGNSAKNVTLDSFFHAWIDLPLRNLNMQTLHSQSAGSSGKHIFIYCLTHTCMHYLSMKYTLVCQAHIVGFLWAYTDWETLAADGRGLIEFWTVLSHRIFGFGETHMSSGCHTFPLDI